MNSIFLTYAGPPLLGAFIGYLTNRIAIRMLFRPLERRYFFGIRVPMTPGVIPAKRRDLARNIGEMVGSHLLTSRDIGAALSEERFQVHLNNLVDHRINEVLNRQLGRLQDEIPERFRAYFMVAARTVKYRLRVGVHRYLRSSEFEDRVTDTVMEQLDSFGDKQLNELVSADERRALYGFLDNLVGGILAGSEAENRLSEYLKNYLEQSAAEGETVADQLPEPLYDLVLEIVRQYSPDMLRHLARVMAEPPVRERIIQVVRNWVENFIRSLGPLGAMAKTFLNMDVLEKRVRDYLIDNRKNIITWLQNPEVQERFSTVLLEQIRKLLDTPLAKILDRAEEGKLDAICRETSIQIFAVLRSQGVKEAMSTLLRENLEEVLGQGEFKMAVIGDRLLSAGTVKSLKVTIAGEAVDLLRTKRVRKLLDRMTSNMFDAFINRPIGILNNLLPPGVRAGITEYSVLTVNRILLREVPGLVERLNIRRIVAEKVDSLDLLKLEGLLLSIMQEQFKYINLFGALLGFLIGLANVVVLQLAG